MRQGLLLMKLLLCGFLQPTHAFVVAPQTRTAVRGSNQRLPLPSLEAVDATTIGSVLAHVVSGGLGTPLVIKATKSWYKDISLPKFTPPNWLFGPVWTTLYAVMGISVSRILKVLSSTTNNPYTHPALLWWYGHFFLNLIWSPVFFGRQQLRAGAAINVALTGSLGMVMRQFYQLKPLSCYLLVPYMLWLLYATLLNVAICRLNPGTYNNARFHADLARLQAKAAQYAGV